MTCLKLAAVIMFGVFATAAMPLDASSATPSAAAHKKAECERRVKREFFRMQRFQRYRWVKECIAGNKPLLR
jgi:hypothetical protein